ncbi:hypothetical protein Daus18300_001069 [Diaporthe australafricana]|uniref:Alcohol dehydrogenase n=1 Tax=Diaporthe australafricana TaxID=127596 RepID=A0ABR3Y051_9PEZI
MKALVLHGVGDLRFEDVAKPTASPGSVVVQVIAAPIWDYISQIIDGSLQFTHDYPLVFGTCCVGRVSEVGADVTSLEKGQLVFCDHIVYLRDAPTKRIVLGYHGGHSAEELRLSSGHWKDGCFAEYARFPSENIHSVDQSALAKKGIEVVQLAEISSIMSAVGAANSINIRAGETVLVMPATGFFSSSAIVAALGLGANVVAVSRSMDNLEAMISHFGEDGQRISPVVLTGDAMTDAAALRAATPGGVGADAYIDFSSPETAGGTHIQAGLRALKRGGRCCFAGMVPPNVPLPYSVIRVNCLRVQGYFAQTRDDVAYTIRLIESGNITLRKSVAGQYKLPDWHDALECANSTRGWESMVVLKP